MGGLLRFPWSLATTEGVGGANTLIFADGFETGDLSRWSTSATDSGDLSVSEAAALSGTYGMAALADDNNSIYVQDNSPNAENIYYFQFKIDPNSCSMGEGDIFFVSTVRDSGDTGVIVLQMNFASGVYGLRIGVTNDATSFTYTIYYTITDAPHTVKVGWAAATAAGANNGYGKIYIDGVLKGTVADMDNDTKRVDKNLFGFSQGIDAGTRGTMFFDDFISRRRPF